LFLLFLVQGLDILFRQDVTLFEERIFFSQLATDCLGLLLTVTYGLQAVAGYTMSGKVFYHALSTSLC
jgi:hypothetical protein